MKTLTRYQLFLWYFGRRKVPLIGYVKPRLISIDDQQIVIKLKLKRRTINHLSSMYFGALAIGADLAGGLHGFYHAKRSKQKVAIAFKSFHAQFLRRPESDVYFVCSMGDTVKSMLLESETTQKRINQPIEVKAYTHYLSQPEEVATFTLELSMKVQCQSKMTSAKRLSN